MATSPRLKWPYPAEGVDPWYESFQGLIEAQDVTTSGLLETKNIIFSGGGTLSWNASTGLLSWSAAITVNSANTGYAETIAAATVSVPQDGLIGYVNFVPFPTGGVALEVLVTDALPNYEIDQTLLLFRRSGSTLYFRNGVVLESGSALPVFDGISLPGTVLTYGVAGAITLTSKRDFTAYATAAVDFTLPQAAVRIGQQVTVKRGAGLTTVAPRSGDTIDGSTTPIPLATAGSAITLQALASGLWGVLSRYNA